MDLSVYRSRQGRPPTGKKNNAHLELISQPKASQRGSVELTTPLDVNCDRDARRWLSRKNPPIRKCPEISSGQRTAPHTVLEHVIPYVHAAMLQENPDHIVVWMPCRTYKENPCLPLDVCLVIGEPFASFVIEHNPDKARWITQVEAAAIISRKTPTAIYTMLSLRRHVGTFLRDMQLL